MAAGAAGAAPRRAARRWPWPSLLCPSRTALDWSRLSSSRTDRRPAPARPRDANTPDRNRTCNLPLWRRLLCQLSYRRSSIADLRSAIGNSALLPLELMHRVLALAVAVLLQLDLGRAAGHLDLGAVVEVVAVRALQPRHFPVLFCHTSPTRCQWSVVSGQLQESLSTTRPSTTDH